MTAAQQAWEAMAQDEASALATMLAGKGRCVMVVIVAADGDEVGTTYLTHGVAGQTTGAHLRQFIVGVERKLGWLCDKLHRRA